MRIFTSVPTGSGDRVLMNIPPWLMLVAQSVRKLPTLRYATGSSCWRRLARRLLSDPRASFVGILAGPAGPGDKPAAGPPVPPGEPAACPRPPIRTTVPPGPVAPRPLDGLPRVDGVYPDLPMSIASGVLLDLGAEGGDVARASSTARRAGSPWRRRGAAADGRGSRRGRNVAGRLQAHGGLLEDEADPGAVELEPEQGVGEPGVLADERRHRVGEPELQLVAEVEHLELGLRRVRGAGRGDPAPEVRGAPRPSARVDGEHLGTVPGEDAGGEHAAAGLQVVAVLAVHPIQSDLHAWDTRREPHRACARPPTAGPRCASLPEGHRSSRIGHAGDGPGGPSTGPAIHAGDRTIQSLMAIRSPPVSRVGWPRMAGPGNLPLFPRGFQPDGGEGQRQGGDPGGSGPRPPGISALLEDLVSPDGAGTSDAATWRPSPTPGTVVGRFEIVRELGRGGFGVVYEALDRELGRSVAFKLLRGSVQPSAREDRLLREAETAARLSHPNIVTLLDMGRCEYGPYLVLELLRGQTLSQRLAPDRALGEALRSPWRWPAASPTPTRGASSTATSPRNVFLCDDGHGEAARPRGWRRPSGGARWTEERRPTWRPSSGAGRPRTSGPTSSPSEYAVPDARRRASLPGRRGTPVTAAAGPRARRARGPVAPGGGRADAGEGPGGPVPGRQRGGGGAHPVLRKVEGSRARASCRRPALPPAPPGARRTSAGPPPPRRRAWHLACARSAAPPGPRHPGGSRARRCLLPFTYLSANRDQAHFADGLAEEILNALVQIDGLRVAGRTSSFPFRGKDAASARLAAQLKVDAVLDGSVRHSGDPACG